MTGSRCAGMYSLWHCKPPCSATNYKLHMNQCSVLLICSAGAKIATRISWYQNSVARVYMSIYSLLQLNGIASCQGCCE